MQADATALYWTELDPKKKGQLSLVRYTKEEGESTPLSDISVRTRVHEYGGGSFCLFEGGVFFSNDEDRQLYHLTKEGKLEKRTDTPDCRYADGQGMIWVAEKHVTPVENYLAMITLKGVQKVASGHDFYAFPRLSGDKKKLAYITWDFPNMQWDSSRLWLADIDEKGKLAHTKPIAGGSDESVCGISWHKNALYFISDRTGFWNLHRYIDGQVEPLHEMEAEFGEPLWVFGRPTYTFFGDDKIVCKYTVKGIDHLGILDLSTKKFEKKELPFTMIQNLVTLKDRIYFFGASASLPQSVISYDPKTNKYSIVKQSVPIAVGEEWISNPEILEFPTKDGHRGYGFYYPPKNPSCAASPDEKPPLIVKVHGGPTSRSYPYLNLQVQYWTSRGFAFLDVNYGGSTGYGRDYLKRLEGNWGIVDVDDCIAATQALVDQGKVDPKRLLIRGGSAGGYTVLAALALTDLFAAGTSYYGVSDLELLCDDSHKFESKYVHKLVGPYPKKKELIRKRSPIEHVDKLTCPVLLLQGTEDKVVPPNQTLTIYEALKKKQTPVGMILFEGEAHGFRQAESIKRSLDSELYFYGKILKINLSDAFEKPPLEIENLKG